MIAMMFSPDIYDYPVPTPLDVSTTDTLKMSVWRTDAEAQLQFAIRYQDPDPTVIDEFGNPMVYESDPVYFDTNEGNPNGAIGADQWVTVEIPLSDFGAIDPSTVVGVMLYTNDHEVN